MENRFLGWLRGWLPSVAASRALTVAVIAALGLFAIGESVQLMVLLPPWMTSLLVRSVLAFGLLVCGLLAALYFMVREYRLLERRHALEIERLNSSPPPYGVQSEEVQTVHGAIFPRVRRRKNLE